MEYEEIIATVQHAAGGIPRGEAERATAEYHGLVPAAP